jgi:hypothetical protein
MQRRANSDILQSGKVAEKEPKYQTPTSMALTDRVTSRALHPTD